jgi:hypothetical protein
MAGKTRVGQSRSTIARYIQNAAKEYAQWNERGRTQSDAGQFWGAVLQGRQYDKKGRMKK